MKSLSTFGRLSFALSLLALLSNNTSTMLAMCGGPTVLWHNTCDTGGIVADVVDQNIDIIGCNALVEGVHVRAETCDILITVTNGDALITGSPIDFPRLYLNPENGNTITFSLAADLTFCGTNAGTTIWDLLVTVTGDGVVIFDIGGGFNVSFTCCSPFSGGTKVFVGMDEPAQAALKFQRLGGPAAPGLNENINVLIGCHSCLGFMAEDPIGPGNLETGLISFDPATSGTGCFFLRIGEDSCLLISGRQVVNGGLANPEIMISDILLDVPAGGEANFIVENASAAAGVPAPLQIVNNNKILTEYLSDPFCEDEVVGQQYGFILGPNGVITVNNLTYIDYIATSTNDSFIFVNTPFDNLQPEVQELLEDQDLATVADYIKVRNPSAMIIDGITDPATGAPAVGTQPATIQMFGSSAIYFTAGTDDNGVTYDISFTINAIDRTYGFGNIVLDVEAQLEVIGDPNGNNALNILSIQVTKTGCSVLPESTETQFPQRTFARDANGEYIQYNLGAWLVNNRINFHDATLLHTDENHRIFERDNLGRPDIASEPTYIGGETWKLCIPVGRPRPTIAFYDSFIRFCTDAGFTGVDLRIPNDTGVGNESTFRFYNNGRCIDSQYGRYVILGTNDGGFSSGGFFINNDSHLDIFQEVADDAPADQLLVLDIGYNTTCITEGINCDITGQFAVQSFWLGNNSNISIGTNADVGTDINGDTFLLTTTPTLFINGDFFSFETHGGSLALPETSGTTGEGGIFVDTNGVLTINPFLRASVSTMVVRSHNGVINLPKHQVFFDHRVGITHWKVDLNIPAQRILIPADQNLSEFTMDWGDLKKIFCICGGGFVPYEPPNTPFPCECPPVTNENLVGLPVVQGAVDEFQIKRSRLGDQMHLLVDGGFIRETIWLTGFNTAEAPVGFIVVQNDGRVGLGTNHTTIDSIQASIMLGINGVQICANGNGVVEVNEDLLINNVCHIMTGTAFGVNGPQTLQFHSHDPKEIRIKSTGLLDLTSFTSTNQIISFGGQLQLVFEPGSRLVTGGGLYVFTDNATITGERVLDADLVAGVDPSDLDPIRVKFMGRGTMRFQEAATWFIHSDTFFGIEADPTCTDITNLTVELLDQAKLQVGNEEEPGGVLQIGNTFNDPDTSVTFSLVLDGIGTEFQINRQGFVGFGVGMVNRSSNIPNNWTVGCLANVNQVTVNIVEGTMRHNQIVSGDTDQASLFAIGPVGCYTFLYTNQLSPAESSVILGGGNMVLLQNCLGVELPALGIREKAEQAAMIAKAQEFVAKLLTNNKDKIVVSVDQIRPLLMSLIDSFVSAKGSNEQQLLAKGSQMLDEMAARSTRRAGKHQRPNIKPLLKAARDKVAEITRAPIGVTLQPTVTGFAGVVNDVLSVGMFASKPLLNDKFIQFVCGSPAALFAYLSTLEHAAQLTPKANIAEIELNTPTLGFITGSTIRRENYFRILTGTSADPADPDDSFAIGAVNINIDDNTGDINNVIEIQLT